MTKLPVKSMKKMMRYTVVIALVLLMTVVVVQAKSRARKQVKGLDEQIHDVKSEVLGIARELGYLEEQLLYPSHTQLAVFVSLRDKANFRLDSIDIVFDGKAVTYHLYTTKELEALKMGGVQKIYTGNVTLGKHELKLLMRGKSSSGKNIRIDKSFTIKKGDMPAIAEFVLSESTITLVDR